MRFVGVLLQLQQQGSDRRLCIPYEAEVNLGATSELFTANVDLHDRRLLGVEVLIRKICSEHKQHIAVHHGAIAGRESEQDCHTDVEGIVILDELLATQCV